MPAEKSAGPKGWANPHCSRKPAHHAEVFESIRKLQRKLYLKAKAEPDCRFHQLYDKVWRDDILFHAWELALFNGGAPGVDGAGWHTTKALVVPPNVTLPPYSPQLNPMERVWLYLRDRFLSLRLLEDYDAIVDACGTAWNVVAEDAERIRSLCLYSWIKKVIS